MFDIPTPVSVPIFNRSLVISTLWIIAFLSYLKNKSDEQLKLYATTDLLTGILNRRAGLLFLEQQMRMAQRQKFALTICFMDINLLKEVNDKYGHSEGDWLINTIANIIKETIRESDVICRLGGDEFLVTFTGCEIGHAKNILDKIQKRVYEVNTEKQKPFTVSFSYGFAEYDLSDKISMDELMSVADKEMYHNKNKFKEQIYQVK
ncbi:MAG: GGDEF domain-containing protein [Candidatus Ratteibacteria bacterium]